MLVVLIVLFTRAEHVPDPVYQGRKLSVWFDLRCKHDPEAFAVFPSMGPESVPYRLRQLEVDRSGLRESLIVWLKGNSFAGRYVKGVELPSSRRRDAVSALGAMGSSAEAALPVLLEGWGNQPTSLKRQAWTRAIAEIMYGLNPSPDRRPRNQFSWPKYLEFEERVMVAAIEHCPEAPERLRVQFAHLLTTAEPGVGADDGGAAESISGITDTPPLVK